MQEERRERCGENARDRRGAEEEDGRHREELKRDARDFCFVGARAPARFNLAGARAPTVTVAARRPSVSAKAATIYLFPAATPRALRRRVRLAVTADALQARRRRDDTARGEIVRRP